MTPRIRIALIALLALAGAAACEGTETGNPIRAEVRVHAHSSVPAAVAVAVGAGGAVVTGTWIAAGGLELIGSDCAEASGQTGPLPAGDYASGGAPQLALELLDPVQCAARVRVTPAAAVGDAPTALVGHTVLLVGTRRDGTPFQLRTTAAGTLTLAATASSFTLDEDMPALFLGFDVATWLDGVDLDGAVANGSGLVLIEPATDPARVAAFDAALAAGVELYRDRDGNGRVDGPDDTLLARGTRLDP